MQIIKGRYSWMQPVYTHVPLSATYLALNVDIESATISICSLVHATLFSFAACKTTEALLSC